jgi:hypothetical protein
MPLDYELAEKGLEFAKKAPLLRLSSLRPQWFF